MKFQNTLSGSGENRDKLWNTHHYVAILTQGFVSDEKCIGEARDAHALNKPMWALQKADTVMTPELRKLKWNGVIIFNGESDYKYAIDLLYTLLARYEKNNS